MYCVRFPREMCECISDSGDRRLNPMYCLQIPLPNAHSTSLSVASVTNRCNIHTFYAPGIFKKIKKFKKFKKIKKFKKRGSWISAAGVGGALAVPPASPTPSFRDHWHFLLKSLIPIRMRSNSLVASLRSLPLLCPH